MYKYTDNTQSNFLSFNQPIGLHMNSEYRGQTHEIQSDVFAMPYSRTDEDLSQMH